MSSCVGSGEQGGDVVVVVVVDVDDVVVVRVGVLTEDTVVVSVVVELAVVVVVEVVVIVVVICCGLFSVSVLVFSKYGMVVVMSGGDFKTFSVLIALPIAEILCLLFLLFDVPFCIPGPVLS
jgi:hypothetical protein